MNWVDKIQEAIDYVEENLFEEITAESVGRAIHYSPSSFQTLFSAITGYSIGEYIRFRRLSCAVDDLAGEKLTITDIALKCKYETVEAFSKAFKRLFGCSPSSYLKSTSCIQRFNPLKIDMKLRGGFGLSKNFIPNLRKVDWSDPQRQNEFVNSIVSALNALGERLDYDTVCAVSGCAFRTSFSMPSAEAWNHGNYHVIHAPNIIGHTFKMLGYRITHHIRGDYELDKQLIMDSIDKGMPVITLEGVINCSDSCVISGYDNDGAVLLGYNPFMVVNEDHDEAPDDTDYFRKSNWHDGFFACNSKGRILIIEGKCEKPSKEVAFKETRDLIVHLIADENLAPGQYNGLAAHRAFAAALQSYSWDDPFEPYLNVMCNYKQYLDRQYAVLFFAENGMHALAQLYQQIAGLCRELAVLIPQDFSAAELFYDKVKLQPYCSILLKIAELEEKALVLLRE
jgi:AraC-like DNA-binding protein